VSGTITDVAADRRQTSGQDDTRRNAANPVKQLQGFGQSVWLDYLRRSLFTSGEFHRLIVEDGLRGATSNPSIFEKANAGSTDYLNALQEIERRHDLEPMALYEALAIRDIRDAADLLHPEDEATNRADGYVSLEVSPYIAHDTHATIEEARRLWKAVNRDNVMIKVPATVAGLPAIRQLVSEGINITLLFGIGRYEEVAHAFIDGPDASRNLPGVRPALPALHRSGLQRGGRIPASFSRSPATTPRTFRCPVRHIRLASSRPPKHVATSRSSSSVTDGHSECIWAQMSASDCRRSRQHSRARCKSTHRV
jgi:hypothetical protein